MDPQKPPVPKPAPEDNPLNPLRTFQSDIEAARRSGLNIPKNPIEDVAKKANLKADAPAGIPEKAETANEEIIQVKGDDIVGGPEVPAMPVPAPEPVLPPIPKKDSYREQVESHEAKPRQESMPYKPPATPTKGQLPEVNVSGLQTVHTYSDDISDAVKKKKESVVSIALAESKKRGKDGLENLPKAAKRNIAYIFISIFLVIGGIGAVGYFYYTYPHNVKVPVEQPTVKSFIVADSNQTLKVDGLNAEKMTDIMKQQFAASNMGPHEFKSVRFTESAEKGGEVAIPTSRVITSLAPKIPNALVRALNEQEYLFGIAQFDSVVPFLILKTISFENAYAGMLGWERTMLADLAIFTNHSGQTGTFEDALVKNKSIRVVRDDLGKPLLMYSFFDNNTLVITTDSDVFNELLTRYISAAKIAQ